MVVAVDYFAKGDLASQSCRKHEGIEGEQQLVVLTHLVGKDEANGDELRRLAPHFGGYALDGVDMSLGREDSRRNARLIWSSGGDKALFEWLRAEC